MRRKVATPRSENKLPLANFLEWQIVFRLLVMLISFGYDHKVQCFLCLEAGKDLKTTFYHCYSI